MKGHTFHDYINQVMKTTSDKESYSHRDEKLSPPPLTQSEQEKCCIMFDCIEKAYPVLSLHNSKLRKNYRPCCHVGTTITMTPSRDMYCLQCHAKWTQ
jgi:hypothetical protein